MTKISALFALSVLSVSSVITYSQPAVAAESSVAKLNLSLLLNSLHDVKTLDLINWKIGDTMNMDLSMDFLGKVGTMVKSVPKEEGAAVWMKQDIQMQGQNQTVEALINRADGKILKLIQNGKEAQIPNDPPEIISQDYTEITVPAGKFKTLHVVVKTKQVSKIELWANPVDTCMDGAVKEIVPAVFGNLTMVLTAFHKMP